MPAQTDSTRASAFSVAMLGIDDSRSSPQVLSGSSRDCKKAQSGSGHDAAWSAAQNHLATLSTNSVHRVIDGATHQVVI